MSQIRVIPEIPVRIERDGKWQALDVFTLTDSELSKFFNEFDKGRAIGWLYSFVKTIRDSVEPGIES